MQSWWFASVQLTDANVASVQGLYVGSSDAIMKSKILEGGLLFL
jgi:hypothetical protein